MYTAYTRGGEMPHFEEALKGERAIREMEAEKKSRMDQWKIAETYQSDCVLVQPDPNAHLGATEE